MSHDSNNCGCYSGHHIWDSNYEKEVKSERFCVCCQHFFMAEDVEENSADGSIEWVGSDDKSKQDKPLSGGFSKGKIKRRP